jgi:hypothetical protein
MALENLATGQDLLYYVLKSGGQSASAGDDYADQAKAAIRSNYWEIRCMEPWWWAMSPTPKVITTVASQNVTASSITGATVTLSGNLTPSVAGQKFFLRSTQAMYRILTHTAGTNILGLDATFIETITSGPGVIYQDEYDLDATCMKIWDPLWLRGQFEGPIDLINEREFKVKYGWTQISATGLTEVAREIRPNAAGNMRIQVAPWSQTQLNIEYDFTLFHDLDFSGAGAGDTPTMPLEDRWVVAERALGILWRNKNDMLADAALVRAQSKLETMRDKATTSATRNRAWVRPRHSLGVG